jgi:hypothetical protein
MVKQVPRPTRLRQGGMFSTGPRYEASYSPAPLSPVARWESESTSTHLPPTTGLACGSGDNATAKRLRQTEQAQEVHTTIQDYYVAARLYGGSLYPSYGGSVSSHHRTYGGGLVRVLGRRSARRRWANVRSRRGQDGVGVRGVGEYPKVSRVKVHGESMW